MLTNFGSNFGIMPKFKAETWPKEVWKYSTALSAHDGEVVVIRGWLIVGSWVFWFMSMFFEVVEVEGECGE